MITAFGKLIIKILLKASKVFGKRAPKLAALAPKLEKASAATARQVGKTALKKTASAGLKGYMGYSIVKNGKESTEKEDGTLYRPEQEYADNSQYASQDEVYASNANGMYDNTYNGSLLTDILSESVYVEGDLIANEQHKVKSIKLITKTLNKFIYNELHGDERVEAENKVKELGGVENVAERIYEQAKGINQQNIFSKKGYGRISYIKFLFCNMFDNGELVDYMIKYGVKAGNINSKANGNDEVLNESITVAAVILILDIALLLFNKLGGLQMILRNKTLTRKVYNFLSKHKYLMWILDFVLFGEPIEQIVRKANEYGFATKSDVEDFGTGIYDMIADATGLDCLRNGGVGEEGSGVDTENPYGDEHMPQNYYA